MGADGKPARSALSHWRKIMRSGTALPGTLARLLPAGTLAVMAGASALPFTGQARAQAVWIGGTSSDYHTSSNWNPAAVPNSTATDLLFGPTALSTTMTTAAGSNAAAFVFQANAPSFIFNMGPAGTGFGLHGAGIVNNSGLVQTVNLNNAGLIMNNSASMGADVVLNMTGSSQLDLRDNSSGGLAAFNLNTDLGVLIDGNNHAVSMGSLSGTGWRVQFSGHNQSLTIGGNNQSTSYSGELRQAIGASNASLTKIGSGTLTLSGDNYYTGGTTIAGGILSVSSSSHLGGGSGPLNLNGGTLQVNGTSFTSSSSPISLGSNGGGIDIANAANTFTLGQSFGGSGGLTKSGAGTLVLNGTNTYNGGTNIDAGTLQIGNAAALGTDNVTINAGGALRSTVDATLTLPNFRFASTGTSVLSAAAGTVLTVNPDRVYLNSTTNIAQFGTTTDTGTIIMAPSSGLTTSASAQIVVAGGTLQAGPGASRILVAITADMHSTTVEAGALLDYENSQPSGDFNAYGIRNLQGGGTVKIGADATRVLNIAKGSFDGGITGAGGVRIKNINGTNNGMLVFGGSNLNTYAGATTIDLGHTLRAGAANALAASSAHTVDLAGTLDLGGFSQTIGSLAGSGVVTNTGTGAATLTTNGNNASTSFSGVINDGAGSTSLTKAGTGTLTLTAAQTYTGATTVEGTGSLVISGNGGIASSSGLKLSGSGGFDISGANGNVVVKDLSGVASSTVNLGANSLSVDSANSTTFAGVMNGINNSGGLIKTGTGTLSLNGINGYTGATTVNGGTLAVNGSIASALTTVNLGATLAGNGTVGKTDVYGTLSAGNSPGSLLVNGDLALKAGSTTVFELGTPGTVGGPSNDLVTVNGNLALAGTLQTPGAVSGYYRLFNVGGSVSGAFDTVPTDTTVDATIPHQVNLLLNQGGQLVQFWDGVDQAGNGTVDGGSATWNATNSNWTGAPGQAGINDRWQNEVGVFSGTAGTVTTSGPLSFQGLQFKTDGYQLAGDALTMTGDANGNAAASFVYVDGGVTTTIANGLTGTGIGLDKLGSGTLVVSGANSYTGATKVAAGTLRAGAANTFVAGSAHRIAAGAVLDLNGFNQSIDTLTGSGTVKLGSGTLSTGGNNASTAFDGMISGTGGITKNGSGTFTLAGTNAYTGTTSVAAGTLLAGAANVFAAGSTHSVASGAALDINSFDQSIGGLSGAGTVKLGSGALTLGGNDASTTFSGSIDGTGGLTKIGSGTFTLAGTTTYSGATDVMEGTLRAGAANTFAAGSAHSIAAGALLDLNGFDQSIDAVTGSGTVKLGSGALTLGGNNASTTFDGTVEGTGSLVKVGTGTALLTGAGSYTGPTLVHNGTLSVDGSIAASSLTTVRAGATLGGNGIVGTTLIDGGILAPGNSIGKLTVAGDLTLTGASTYMVELSPSKADFTHVTGKAALNGATVAASFENGSYIEKRYTILTADAGVDGTFSGLVETNLPANFKSALAADGKNAYLDLALDYAPPGPTPPSYGSGLNVNQNSVANALVNSFNANGGIPLAFGALGSQGLSQASGEIAITASQAAFDAQSQFLNTLTNLSGTGAPVPSASQSPMGYAGEARKSDAFSALAPMDEASFERRWHAFGAAYGGSARIGGNAALGSHDATSRVYGGMAGASYVLSPSTEVGFALGGGGTSFDLADGMGSGNSEMFQAGIFAHHGFAQGGYVKAALAYGWHDVDTDRVAPTGERLRGSYNANVLSGRLETGWRVDTPFAGVTPYAAAQTINYRMPAYMEQGNGAVDSLALDYAGRHVTATRIELGLGLDRSMATDETVITLRGRAAWAHNFSTDRNVAAAFQALPGTSFVVNGAAMAPNAALVSAGAEVAWRNGLALAGSFEGEFSSNVTSYAGKAILKYAW